jgi:hypothetical protein
MTRSGRTATRINALSAASGDEVGTEGEETELMVTAILSGWIAVRIAT